MLFFALPIEGTADELGALSYPATLAGFDWSDALAGWCNYYGGGFTVLFTPLFLLFSDEPVVLYRAILLICIIAQTLCAFICYRILTRYLHVADHFFAVVTSAAISYLLLIPGVVYVNEHAVILIVWLIALLLFKLADAELTAKKRAWLSILLLLLLSWSILIHTRCIVLWFATALAIFVYRWSRKLWLISPVFVLPAIASFFVCRFVTSEAVRILWGEGNGNVANASVQITSDLQLLFSHYGMKAWIFILSGHIVTYAELTAGLVLFAFSLSAAILFLAIFRRHSFFSDDSSDITEVKSRSLLVVTVFFASAIATILAFLFSGWSTSLANLMLDKHPDTIPIISITYIRYAYCYCGPLVMVFLAFVYHKIRLIRFSVLFTVPIFVGAAFVWQKYIIPFVLVKWNSSFVTQTNLPFGFYAFTEMQHKEPMVLNSFILIAALLFLTAGIFSIAGKKRVLSIVLLVLLMYQYIYLSYFFYYPTDLKLTEQISPFLQTMDTARNLDALPEKVAVQASNSNFILAQFYNPDVAFTRIPDDQTIPTYVVKYPLDNILVYRYDIQQFSPEEISQMISLGYGYVILGPQYALFSKDVGILEAVLENEVQIYYSLPPVE